MTDRPPTTLSDLVARAVALGNGVVMVAVVEQEVEPPPPAAAGS